MSRQASRWFPLYSGLLLAAGVASVVALWIPVPGSAYLALGILMLAAFSWENAAVPLPRGGEASLVFPMITAATLLMGPSAAGLVALSSTVTVKEIRNRKSWATIVGNGGVLALSSVLPASLFLLMNGRLLLDPAGRSDRLSVGDFPQIILPLAVFVSVSFLMNVVLVGTGLSLRDGVPLRRFLKSVLPWSLPSPLSFAVLGVAMAQVLTIHPAAFVLLVFPLMVASQVYQRYLSLKGMYHDTVKSLVGALEAKDPYTRGHSERVASHAATLAKSLGMSEERVERVVMAAQLHDLGKVAIRSDVLQKSSGLTSGEYEEIRHHPEVGARIIEGIPELDELAEIVRNHHERYDGLGYGRGLRGPEIPLESRLLAVADSFDAMTSERAYRAGVTVPEALEEIEQCAGTQFDPHLASRFVGILRGEIADEHSQ